MKERKAMVKSVKSQSSAPMVRATISFPAELYANLEQIAKQRKVSLAWVVRDAAERYLAKKSGKQA